MTFSKNEGAKTGQSVTTCPSPSDNQWYRIYANGVINVDQWGLSGDKPVPGDYDGDGRTDLAVFRPTDSTWYLLRSTSGITAQAFGITGDKPTPNAYVY